MYNDIPPLPELLDEYGAFLRDLARALIGGEMHAAAVPAEPRTRDTCHAVLSRVMRALRDLPAPCREVVHLSYAEGLGIDGIAHQLGLAETAVRSCLEQALAIVRARLDQLGAWRSALGAILLGERPPGSHPFE